MTTSTDPAKIHAEHEARVWELVNSIRFCMFGTWNGTRLQQRPLTAIAAPDEHSIYFLIDESTANDWDAGLYPAVTLSFAHPGKNEYLAISGTAEISNDRERIRQYWSPFARAWWDSENDGRIRLLTVTPQQAELWEGPNRLFAGAIMLAASAANTRPAVGDHAHVEL